MREARSGLYAVVPALVTAAVTRPLHAPLFAALAPLRVGAAVRYLSTRMPRRCGVILVVHCLRDPPVAQPRVAARPAALAGAVALHLWRRNALLSILAGMAAHAALASTPFGTRLGIRPLPATGRTCRSALLGCRRGGAAQGEGVAGRVGVAALLQGA